MATSVIDYIFRDLAISYLKRTDLGQVNADDLLTTGTKSDSLPGVKREISPAASDNTSRIREAKLKGYEGDPCPSCGSFTLVRNGTCMKCDTCGGTTGCS
jgi:ribonucleoside-diphosphate reductase alpha chain